jgi:FAD/FMN-containing dehydrogenase
MYDIAMERYGGVPMRVKSGYPTLENTGGYGDLLARIKKVCDPNNILSPNMGIFPEVMK